MASPPDSWSETAFVNISIEGGSDYDFRLPTTTIDIDLGNKDFDSEASVGGGRIRIDRPQEDSTITLEYYPQDINPDGGSLIQHFNGGTFDASQPLTSLASRNRTDIRIAILWTDDPAATSANGAVASDYNGLRFVAAEARVISDKPSYTDKELKHTAQIKFTPFDRAGAANYKVESTDDTAILAALASYTDSVKW